MRLHGREDCSGKDCGVCACGIEDCSGEDCGGGGRDSKLETSKFF